MNQNHQTDDPGELGWALVVIAAFVLVAVFALSGCCPGVVRKPGTAVLVADNVRVFASADERGLDNVVIEAPGLAPADQYRVLRGVESGEQYLHIMRIDP